MKKLFRIFTLAAMAVFAASCGNSSKQTADTEIVSTEVSDTLSVDELLSNPEKYVAKTVTINGLCSHLCKHGGAKAFVKGNGDNMLIRCEAFPGMDEPFSADAIQQPVRVTGVFHEERIDEDYLAEMESTEQARVAYVTRDGGEAVAGEQQSGCDTERAARGQQELNSLNECIADYRARIADRQAKEGKAYLSFYYLETTGYEILPE